MSQLHDILTVHSAILRMIPVSKLVSPQRWTHEPGNITNKRKVEAICKRKLIGKTLKINIVKLV